MDREKTIRTGSGKVRAGEAAAFLEIVLAMALAGSSVVAGKYLTGVLPVFTAGALSLFFAVLTMLPFQVAGRSAFRRLSKGDFANAAFQALFGIALFRVFTFSGLRLTTAFHAGIITSASPAAMTVLSMTVLRERPPAVRIAGILCSVAGILIIHLTGAGTEPLNGRALAGSLLVFLAVCCEGLLIVFRKSSRPAVDAVTNTTLVCLSGFMFMAPFAVVECAVHGFPSIAPGTWLVLLYYGVIVTAGGYLLMGAGAPRIPGSAAGAAMSAMPVSAFLLSVLVLGEKPAPIDAAGCLLAVSGMVLGSRSGRGA